MAVVESHYHRTSFLVDYSFSSFADGTKDSDGVIL